MTSFIPTSPPSMITPLLILNYPKRGIMFEGGQGGNVNLDKMDEAQTYFTYCLMKLQGPAKSFSSPPLSLLSQKSVCPQDPGLQLRLYVKVLVAQLCPSLYNPMDCSLSGSSVQGILQGRILELVAIPNSSEPFQPRDQTRNYLGEQRMACL